MPSRRDSRTEDEIRKELHESNSTQTNCDLETLTGLRIRNVAQVLEEDAAIKQDVEEDKEEESSYDAENKRNEELCDLLEHMRELVDEPRKPDFSLAPVWFMTCVLAYLYGVTLGLYMCDK